MSQPLDAVLSKGQTMPEKNRFPAVLQPAPQAMAFDQHYQPSSITPTLLGGGSGGRNEMNHPVIGVQVTHTLRGKGFDASEDGTGLGTPLVPVTSPTLDARAGRSGETSFATSGGLVPVAIQERAVCENPNAGPDGAGFRTDGMAYTLEARSVPQAVAFAAMAQSGSGWAPMSCPTAEEVALTLDTKRAQAVAFSCKDHGADAGPLAPTLRAMGHDGSHANAGGQLAVAIPINMQAAAKTGKKSPNMLGIGNDGDPAPTLGANDIHAVALAQNTRDEVRLIGGDGSIAGALAAEPGIKQQTYVGCFKGGQGSKAGSIGYDEQLAPTLSSADSGSNRTPALMHGMQVRRLTPEECEALQGFPRSYTAIPYRGKPAADGPRYKALGNSMAVPCMYWIGWRIERVWQSQQRRAA